MILGESITCKDICCWRLGKRFLLYPAAQTDSRGLPICGPILNVKVPTYTLIGTWANICDKKDTDITHCRTTDFGVMCYYSITSLL